MNKLFALTLSALLLSTAALSYADGAQIDDAKTAGKTAQMAKKTSDGSASPMMMDNMKKMQDQMAKLHASKDPKERAKLMQDHMQSMQETMKMMHDGKRMDMMQMMMDQMMEHQKAMHDMGK